MPSGRRHRLACGGHPLLRRRVRSADGRAAARHRLPPVPAGRPAHTGLQAETRRSSCTYTRSRQDEGRRDNQLLGGDGNLVADLRGLTLDLFYARVERIRAGPVRSCVAHLFRQFAARGTREPGRKRQPARRRSPSNPSGPRCTGSTASVEGAVSPPDASARRRRVRRGCGCPIDRAEPADGRRSTRRGRVPDGASYSHGGGYAQTFYDAVPTGCACTAVCA